MVLQFVSSQVGFQLFFGIDVLTTDNNVCGLHKLDRFSYFVLCCKIYQLIPTRLN